MNYSVIIADPPWSYSNSGARGVAANHYDTMSIDELCDLPVKELAAADAVLLMWCTWPQIKEGLRLIESWGFSYVTGFPWVKITDEPRRTLWGGWAIKPTFGVGFWVRGCTEMVLIARRGKPQLPDRDFVGLLSENFGHSRKPENLYEYAEAMPGPYLEMFARRKRPGWDVFGNEVESDVQIAMAASRN